jgi:hypothetical protein
VGHDPRPFMQSRFSSSSHECHITPNNSTNDTQRHLYCCRDAVFLIFRSLIGTLLVPLDVFMDDLGLRILQFSLNPGLQSLRLRVKFQLLIEGLDGPLLLDKYRALREGSIASSRFPQSPVRQDFDYRALREAVPGSLGIVPGLGGSNTGLRGKWYRASEEIIARFSLQIRYFFKRRSVLCLKSV